MVRNWISTSDLPCVQQAIVPIDENENISQVTDISGLVSLQVLQVL